MGAKLFIIAGQSNAQGYGPIINTLDEDIASPYVPVWAQTAANEWTGSPPASIDTGYQYRYPKSALHPCLYNESTNGILANVYDYWGAFDKQRPTDSSGTMALSSAYGPELSFLQRIRNLRPSWDLACIKQSSGGAQLRGDWLPNTVEIGTAQGGSSTTITLTSGNIINPTGRVLRVTSGDGEGSVGTCTSYDSGSKVATLSGGWSGDPPANGSGYGIERNLSQILRTLIEQAFIRTPDLEPGAFVWMQGESGAHSPGIVGNDGQYLSDARALFAAVRSWTGWPTLPVLVGRIGDNWGWETDPNPYLDAVGYPWAAMDYSINGDGRIAGDQPTRDGMLAGAIQRRATQVTLGGDANCAWWDNDGYPMRPPFSLTEAETDLTGYHYGGPGYMTMGERAANKFLAEFDSDSGPSLSVHIGGTA